MEKLLVTGVDDLVGYNLALHLADRFDVLGLYQAGNPKPDGCRTQRCDLSDPKPLADCLREEAPQWTIHCGPLARSSWDLAGSSLPADDQPAVVRALAQAAAETKSRLAVISTDAAFWGPRLFNDETGSTSSDPVAAAVLAMEQSLQGTESLIVRTHAYGWSQGGRDPGYVGGIIAAIEAGRSCTVDTQAYATPILAADLAELLLAAYQQKLVGLYHMGGAERISQYQFAQEAAAAFGFECRGVAWQACSTATLTPQRRHETSLSSVRAQRALSTPLPLVREGLARFVEQAASRSPATFQGAILERSAA